ncbi:hypothetical protein ACT6QH_02135 [Xanthobacter sp. TB0139]|uniref:hypothetical protein n=1 Tax=Xanthobacter sp. TB0139 TaxID=3459178 RepID=UPI00403A692B
MLNSPHADPQTIQQLEHMLNLARAGKITGIAMVALPRDGAPVFGASNSAVNAATIGGMDMLKARLVDAANQHAGA